VLVQCGIYRLRNLPVVPVGSLPTDNDVFVTLIPPLLEILTKVVVSFGLLPAEDDFVGVGDSLLTEAAETKVPAVDTEERVGEGK